MSNNRSGSSGVFLGGLLLGAAIGTVTGLLIAPRPGRETRQILKKSADALPELVEDLATTVQLQADRLSESTLRNWEETLVRLRDSISAGLEASQWEYQSLSGSNPEPSPDDLEEELELPTAPETTDYAASVPPSLGEATVSPYPEVPSSSADRDRY